MRELRTFDFDGWGINRVAQFKNPYARFSRGDRVIATGDFRDFVLRDGEHVYIDVKAGEQGVVVFPGPDAFGLVRVEFQGVTLDAWDSDVKEVA